MYQKAYHYSHPRSKSIYLGSPSAMYNMFYLLCFFPWLFRSNPHFHFEGAPIPLGMPTGQILPLQPPPQQPGLAILALLLWRGSRGGQRRGLTQQLWMQRPHLALPAQGQLHWPLALQYPVTPPNLKQLSQRDPIFIRQPESVSDLALETSLTDILPDRKKILNMGKKLYVYNATLSIQQNVEII